MDISVVVVVKEAESNRFEHDSIGDVIWTFFFPVLCSDRRGVRFLLTEGCRDLSGEVVGVGTSPVYGLKQAAWPSRLGPIN